MSENENRVMTFIMTVCTIAMLIVSISTCNSSVKVTGIEKVIQIQQSNDSTLMQILSNQTKQTSELKDIVYSLNENIILLDSNYSQNVNLIVNTAKLVEQNSSQSQQIGKQNKALLKQLKQSEENQKILSKTNQLAKKNNDNQLVFKQLMTADYLKQYQKTKESWWSFYSRKTERDMVAKSEGKMTYPIHRKFESDISTVYNNIGWDIQNLKSIFNNIISLLNNKDISILEQEILFQSEMVKKLEENIKINPIYKSDTTFFFKEFEMWDKRNMELIRIINTNK